MRKAAFDFADRLLKEAGPEPAQAIERAYQLALARPPSPQERGAALAFVELQTEERQETCEASCQPKRFRRQALADLCQAIFSLNEFLYVD